MVHSLLNTADLLKIEGFYEISESFAMDHGNESMTDISVLGGYNTQDKTQKQRLLSRFKTGKHIPAVKRKLSPSNTSSPRKYCTKEPIKCTEQNVQLLHITTINPADIGSTPQYHNLQPASCITVATSTEDDEKDIKPNMAVPVINPDDNQPLAISSSSLHYLSDSQSHAEKIIMTSPSPVMSSSITTLTTLQPQQPLLIDQNVHLTAVRMANDDQSRDVEIIIPDTQPPAPTATPVPVHCHSIEMQQRSPTHRDIAVNTSGMLDDDVKMKFETLRTMDQTSDSMDTMENHLSEHSLNDMNDDEHAMHTIMVTPELLGLIPSTSSGPSSEVGSDNGKNMSMKKEWTQGDMDAALDALRNHNMSLTKASNMYGIPSTTLWQRAHRLGIDTPKKEGTTKWNEDVLNIALDALRTGSLSANKASKAYGIPSSTLYKIARREGIKLAAPFNATPTTWTQEHLERALDAIRTGQTTVQKAATEYGIPTGTLYGRCKREKIELSRSNPTPWSQDAMSEALEAIRLGQMSINQASIHYNLPYSSLYGRFRRGKYETDHTDHEDDNGSSMEGHSSSGSGTLMVQHSTEIHGTAETQQSHQQSLQPQIMLLQYQHTPATHIQMYQPAAPS